MSHDSFQEKFPDYPIIPSKQRWYLRWISTVVTAMIVVGAPIALLYQLSQVRVPTPLDVGINKFSLTTAKTLAVSQMQAGQHQAAVENFGKYFAMGGNDADVMELYAKSLEAVGLKNESRRWVEKSKIRKFESEQ